MAESPGDLWSQWLLKRRDGGDPETMLRFFNEFLRPIRDRVLEHAALEEGGTLLDVGCGDGLIGFGALEKTKTGLVIFSDISKNLLGYAEALAADLGLADRCRFLQAPAEDLHELVDGSVDVVTTRSVLIYVRDKQGAFLEFQRVLKPGGRISLFEPINSFTHPSPDHMFAGYNLTPVVGLVRKIKEVYRQAQPEQDNPMLDFDERDLLQFAEQAGFSELHLNLEINIEPMQQPVNWESFLKSAPNPLAPTLEEAAEQAFSPAEREEFLACLRPLVEQNLREHRLAVAYLWAVK